MTEVRLLSLFPFPFSLFVYLLVYLAGGYALAGFPTALSIYGTVGLLLPAASFVVVILVRRRHWHGCQRLFWDTMAIGMVLWCIGHAGWAYGEIVLRRPSWLQWHTLFSLCGGAAPLVALVARPHRGARADVATRIALDIAGWGLLAAFVFTYFVMVPSVLPGQEHTAEVSLLVIAPVLRLATLVTLGATVWGARGSAWQSTLLILAAGVGIGVVFRIETSLAILRGSYQSGTFRDLAWIVPFLCYVWAAVQAPVSQEEPGMSAPRRSMLPIVLSAAPVLLIPVIGYGWLQVASLGPSGDSFRALVTSLLTVGGLGLLTIRLVAQGDELRRADARVKLLAAATEQTGDLILITRADGAFEHANEAFVRAIGYTRRELGTLRFGDLVARGSQPLREDIVEHVKEHGIWRGTLRRRRRDGSTFPSSCTVAALKDPHDVVTHFVAVERDITDELQLRDQIVHSERLSAVGELVSGVAHELNNPLQTIVGCVELMLDGQRDPASRRDLELVKREAGRAGQIIRNLLAFVRRTSRDRAVFDLNDIVRVTVELRQYHLERRNIRLNVRYAPVSLKVLVNREEIQQIILNLLLNSEQAIAWSAGRGTITIRTAAGGTRQIVEISDDGPGISPELKGRIFEPFFSTKEVGEGTGLGLSISHGIATAHGGSLDVCDGEAGGACFRLALPRVEAVEAQGTTSGLSP